MKKRSTHRLLIRGRPIRTNTAPAAMTCISDVAVCAEEGLSKSTIGPITTQSTPTANRKLPNFAQPDVALCSFTGCCLSQTCCLSQPCCWFQPDCWSQPKYLPQLEQNLDAGAMSALQYGQKVASCAPQPAQNR